MCTTVKPPWHLWHKRLKSRRTFARRRAPGGGERLHVLEAVRWALRSPRFAGMLARAKNAKQPRFSEVNMGSVAHQERLNGNRVQGSATRANWTPSWLAYRMPTHDGSGLG